ncbi:MAG: trypsin-like peptidase domain-containing protein [Actinobacteria bacterium]|nr:trypsin-like peptidase domain-containing protein [Actinomycetota bacterium]
MRSIRFGRLAATALVALSVFAGGGPARAVTATPEEKAAAVVRPSIVYIEMEWTAWVRVPRNSELYFTGYVNDGQPFTWVMRCSGFIVNPTGYIVTAGHCVDEGEQGARGKALAYATQWLIDDGWAYQRDFEYWLNEGHLTWGVEGEERGSPPDLTVNVQRGVAAGGLKTGEGFPARVVDSQSIDDGDVALLKIEQSDLPVVQVAPASEIAIGTDVLSVGYPGSSDQVTDATYEPTFKDGQINSQKTREGGLLPVYEVSAAMSGGMSGGPTVDLTGQVVGVNSFSIVGETEAFNFITPSSLVLETLAKNGVSNELGPIDEAYRAGLDAYYAGDYQAAVEKFDEVLALSPTHQQAQEFKVKASQEAANAPKPAPAADEGGGGGGFPVWLIAAVAGGAFVILLVIVLATRRRKPAPVVAAVVPMAPMAPPVAAVGTQAAPPAQEAARTVGFQPPTPPTATPTEPEPLRAGGPPTPQGGGGAAPEERRATTHFCANCGQGLQSGARFCASCGHPVG